MAHVVKSPTRAVDERGSILRKDGSFLVALIDCCAVAPTAPSCHLNCGDDEMILGEKKVPVEERLHMLGDPIGNGLVAVVLVDQDVNDAEGGVASRSMLRVAADHPEKNGRDNHTLENNRTNQFHINEELMEMLLKSMIMRRPRSRTL